MRAPSSRTRKIVGLSAGPMAVLLAGALVWQGSSAAFTANTSTPANNWTSGQISLTDNDSDLATFNIGNMAPGASGSKCITVTANSSVDVAGTLHASVKNVTNDTTAAKEFADVLQLTMERGTGTKADCSDFAFAGSVFSGSLSTLGGSAQAAAGSAAANSATVVQYKISYSFPTTNLTQAEQNALMGKSTSAELVWELKAGAS